MGVDERCQTRGIALMQRFHARIVTLEERPVAGKILTQCEVTAGYLE